MVVDFFRQTDRGLYEEVDSREGRFKTDHNGNVSFLFRVLKAGRRPSEVILRAQLRGYTASDELTVKIPVQSRKLSRQGRKNYRRRPSRPNHPVYVYPSHCYFEGQDGSYHFDPGEEQEQ